MLAYNTRYIVDIATTYTIFLNVPTGYGRRKL
jgi:hypothetical protein